MTSYDYSQTQKCLNSDECSQYYNNDTSGYPNGNWECENEKCVLKCFNDDDCGQNNMCTYDSDNKIQKCSNLDYQDLSLGCISEDQANSKFLQRGNSSNSDDVNESLRSCIKWSRQQSCNGEDCNYLIYKEPIQTPIDINNNLSIKIKCKGGDTVRTITGDVRKYCSGKNPDSCVYDIPSDTIDSVRNNNSNCNEFEVVTEYGCINQEGTNTNTTSLDEPISLTCPTGDGSSFNAKCMTSHVNPTELKFISENNCQNPVYKVPLMYSTEADLKEIMSSAKNAELKSIQEQLKDTKEKMNELKIRQFKSWQKSLGNELDTNEAIQLMEQLEEERKEHIEEKRHSEINNLESELSRSVNSQVMTMNNLNNIEQSRINESRHKLDSLDGTLNTITSNIVKTQTKEAVQVGIIKFLFVLLMIFFIFAVITFIYFNIKKST